MARRLPRVYHAPPDRWVSVHSRWRASGSDRALERRYLRPRGRRDREPRQPLAVDGDRRRWRHQAGRRRRDRVRGRPPGARPARRIDRHPGRLPGRPGGHPRRVARPRPPHERPGHRGGRPERHGPAREIGATSVAFPALGTGVGGFPLDEAARITVETVRDELDRSPTIEHVIFALRGAAAYQAFGAAIIAPSARRFGGGAA